MHNHYNALKLHMYHIRDKIPNIITSDVHFSINGPELHERDCEIYIYIESEREGEKQEGGKNTERERYKHFIIYGTQREGGGGGEREKQRRGEERRRWKLQPNGWKIKG